MQKIKKDEKENMQTLKSELHRECMLCAIVVHAKHVQTNLMLCVALIHYLRQHHFHSF